MTLRAPEPLALQHRLEGFDCGKPALNDWLLRHARQAQGGGSAKTFVVADGDDRVAGYFNLTVGQVDTLEAPERIRKGMGQYPLPVVILARLAVSVVDQGRGIGFGLLQDAIRRTMLIAEQAGITMAQMSIAWTLQNKNVASAIVGATRPEQLDDNVKAAGIVLEADTLKAIDKVLEGIIISDPRKTESPKTRP